MELNADFWLLLAANLPLVTAFFVALTKRWIVMGVSVDRELASKDNEIKAKSEEIEFREKLRQEVLLDKKALEQADREKIAAIKELNEVVKRTLDLNEQLLDKGAWHGDK